MDSSRWNLGLGWGSDSPCNPEIVQFHSLAPPDPGNPIVGYIMNVLKESEMDVLATPWVNAWMAYLLAVQWATVMVEDNKITTKVLDHTEYDEVVIKEESKMVDAFSSKIINTRMCWRCIAMKQLCLIVEDCAYLEKQCYLV